MASKNKLIIFVLNCTHALKEMTSPNDLSKSLIVFRDLFFILVALIAGWFYFLFFDTQLDLVHKITYGILWFNIIGSLWFIKNTLYVIKNIVNTLISDRFKAVLSKEITCMDETCCIPGNVKYYKYLLFLTSLAMLAFVVIQCFVAYFSFFQFSFISILLVLLSYAGFIHSDKRLYEISKLLNKKEHQATDEESQLLVKTKEFFRIKFAYISMSGFVGSLLVLIFWVLFNIGLNESYQFLLHSFSSIALGLLLISNQISMRVAHISILK